LRFFDVSKSGYYDWRERQPSIRAIEDFELKKKIQQIFTENKGRYGSPRIFKALLKAGYHISKRRVERLYRELGLVARVVRVTYRSAGLKRFLATGENLRPEGGVPKAKHKVWVADVTYLKVKGAWRYLSVCLAYATCNYGCAERYHSKSALRAMVRPSSKFKFSLSWWQR